MDTIERVKEWLDGYIQQREKEYGSAFHKDEKSIEEFYNFLSSLAAERCVWAWDNDGFYHTSCGKAWQFSDDRKGIGDFDTCPFKGCGKRIEVKEVKDE